MNISTNIDMNVLITIIGALVVVVNIITQVLKKVTWDKIPTNTLATIISVALTVVAYFAYAQITNTAVTWYMVVASLIVGMFVAYGAMFGFDKLKETLGFLAEIKTSKSTDDDTTNAKEKLK